MIGVVDEVAIGVCDELIINSHYVYFRQALNTAAKHHNSDSAYCDRYSCSVVRPSVRLSVSLSVTLVHPLLRPLDGMRCYLAGTLLWSRVTLC